MRYRLRVLCKEKCGNKVSYISTDHVGSRDYSTELQREACRKRSHFPGGPTGGWQGKRRTAASSSNLAGPPKQVLRNSETNSNRCSLQARGACGVLVTMADTDETKPDVGNLEHVNIKVKSQVRRLFLGQHA